MKFIIHLVHLISKQALNDRFRKEFVFLGVAVLFFGGMFLFTPSVKAETGIADLVEGLQPQISALNKLGPSATPQQFIGRLIKIVMGVIGSVALLIFVFGGIMWMTAGGNDEKVDKAMKTLTWAALGVVVILASYVIVSFIFGVL